MPKRTVNSAYYKNQVSNRSPYASQMKKAVSLYESSKIEREDTLKKTFTLLKSRGEQSNKKGIELLNKYSEAEPAIGKIKRTEKKTRDNLLHFHSEIRATALNSKVKEVELRPNVMGEDTKSQIRRIIVTGFNEALKKVGKDKAYKVEAGVTIITDERTLHAYGVCNNHTDSVEFNRWLRSLVHRVELIMQSLDIELLVDFVLYFKIY